MSQTRTIKPFPAQAEFIASWRGLNRTLEEIGMPPADMGEALAVWEYKQALHREQQARRA